jgi:hypothetical protein
MPTPMHQTRTGYSMIGMLITLVCIVILFSIGMSALNRAMTGEGSALRGTVGYDTRDSAFSRLGRQSSYPGLGPPVYSIRASLESPEGARDSYSRLSQRACWNWYTGRP